MKLYKKLLSIIAVSMLLLTACGPDVSPSPTAASPTPTQTATSTPTVKPTRRPTPTPSPTPTLRPTVVAETAAPTMAQFYVSPSGNDANNGTSASRPFKTLTKAQQAVRAKIKTGMTGYIYVNLAGGEYFLSEPLQFTPEDSATNNFKVIWRGPEAQTATVTGGKRVTGWTKATDVGTGIYKATVGVESFRQFYVNGQRRTRARSTKVDEYSKVQSWHVSDAEIKQYLVDGGKRYPNVNTGLPAEYKYGVMIPSVDLPWTTLKNISDVEFVLLDEWALVNVHLKALHQTGKNTLIAFEDLEGANLIKCDWPPKRLNQPFYLENAIEFLDEPGEWYLDKTTSTLYYKPMSGENMSTAKCIIPAGAESLFNFAGKVTNSKDYDTVKGISFRNLKFEYTSWLLPDELGVEGNQAMAVVYHDERYSIIPVRVPGAINGESVEDIAVENCIFRHLGGAGIEFSRITNRSRIVGNVFWDISSSAISLGDTYGGSPVGGILCYENYITNNYISNVANQYGGACGVGLFTVSRTIFEHNVIEYVPYSGLSVGWGWTTKKSIMENNMIRYNEIHHTNLKLIDGGGVYTLSRQDGTRIEQNYFHDINMPSFMRGAPVYPIYLDAGSTFMTVKDNYIENCDRPAHDQGDLMGEEVTNDLSQPTTTDTAVRDKAGLEPAYEHIKNTINK